MTMKQLLILSLISAIVVVGCNMSYEIKDAGENDLVEVSLAFTGDITVSETPLGITKLPETDSQDLYGVQIYQDGQYYAYGLFDNVSNMKLFLHSGCTYKAVCTLIKNGKALGEISSDSDYAFYVGGYINTSILGSGIPNVHLPSSDWHIEGNPTSQHLVCYGESGYTFPFVLTTKYDKLRYSYSNSTIYIYKEYDTESLFYLCRALDVTNSFIYDSTIGMNMLSNGITTVVNDDDEGKVVRSKYTSNYRYYGLCDNYSPTNGGVIALNMKHVGFSYQFSISGISDGTVSLSIYNDDITFVNDTYSSDYTSDIRHHTFEQFEDAWKYDDYTENLTISMRWMRGIGIEQDLGSQVIQIKGNTLNSINIDLSTN